MKLTALILLAPLLALAAAPTDSDLAEYLAGAVATWGVDAAGPVRFVLDPMNPCDLHTRPQVATMQWLDVQTTLTFDDAPAVLTHRLTYVIHINSNCPWTPAWLRQVVLHEYGHVLLGGDWHSRNKSSIMFYVVEQKPGKQTITPEDRKGIPHAPTA